MKWNVMRNVKPTCVDSLYSSSSRALTFPDFLIRQMDLLLMSVLDLLGPSTAMPANKRGSRVYSQYADTGRDWAFTANMRGIFIEGACLPTCVRAVRALFRCDLKSKEETSGVCLRGCKYSRSRMLLFTHILKVLCAVTYEFILSLFLTGCPGSQGVGWYRFALISWYYWKDIKPSHHPSDGWHRCGSSAWHVHARQPKPVLFGMYTQIKRPRKKAKTDQNP